MVSITSFSILIGFFFITPFSIYTITYILKNKEEFGTNLIAYLNATSIFIGGIITSSFYLLSVIFYFSEDLNLIFWKLSIVFYISFLINNSIIYSFFREYGKLQVPFNVFLAVLFGVLIGDLIRIESIKFMIIGSVDFIISNIALINFQFDLITSILIIIIILSISIYLLYTSLSIAFSSGNIDESFPLFLNTLLSTIPIMMYIFYLFLDVSLYRELFITLFWIATFAVNMMFIKKPEMFFILPNRVYGINIYHKSGILLYSYKITKKKMNEIDPTIWSNILIGLNHILSEFLGEKDKIEVIQTPSSDIVVKYDSELGFALVINTNRKNVIIDSLMNGFITDFKREYRNELLDIQDLNRIINVSDFINTKEIIEKHFSLYI